MSTIIVGLCITAMVMGASVTIVRCWVWYEQKMADWHHKMMQESFADGWDAAVHMREDK
jgi:hypothetical protein